MNKSELIIISYSIQFIINSRILESGNCIRNKYQISLKRRYLHNRISIVAWGPLAPMETMTCYLPLTGGGGSGLWRRRGWRRTAIGIRKAMEMYFLYEPSKSHW